MLTFEGILPFLKGGTGRKGEERGKDTQQLTPPVGIKPGSAATSVQLRALAAQMTLG